MAAAGGLPSGIKQLWRPATLWELGDVAGPPCSPSPAEQPGFRAVFRLHFGMCTSVGSAVFGLGLDWVPLDASVPKEGQNSFSHIKKYIYKKEKKAKPHPPLEKQRMRREKSDVVGGELWGWVMGVPSIMFTFSRWEFPLSLSRQRSGSVIASVRASPVPHPLVLGQWSIFSCSRGLSGERGRAFVGVKTGLWQLGLSPREFVILEERWM